MMGLLTKRQYLDLLCESAMEVTPAEDVVARVLKYATRIWPELELKPRTLKPKDVAAVFQHDDATLFHVKAFPRKMPETFVIVSVDHTNEIPGHILIDLAAEYAEPFLDCRPFNFHGVPTAEDLETLIPAIDPDDDDPFAILGLTDGTYMQTYRGADGYVLEHQLVNTSSHYEIPELASAEQVVAAMTSYAFGNNEWLELFDWQRQDLS